MKPLGRAPYKGGAKWKVKSDGQHLTAWWEGVILPKKSRARIKSKQHIKSEIAHMSKWKVKRVLIQYYDDVFGDDMEQIFNSISDAADFIETYMDDFMGDELEMLEEMTVTIESEENRLIDSRSTEPLDYNVTVISGDEFMNM